MQVPYLIVINSFLGRQAIYIDRLSFIYKSGMHNALQMSNMSGMAELDQEV